MNIYDAREVQKMLYKTSGALFTRAITVLSSETNALRYAVVHQLSDTNGFEIDEDFIKRVYDVIKHGVRVQLGTVTKDINPSVPEGFYVAEIIEID